MGVTVVFRPEVVWTIDPTGTSRWIGNLTPKVGVLAIRPGPRPAPGRGGSSGLRVSLPPPGRPRFKKLPPEQLAEKEKEVLNNERRETTKAAKKSEEEL